MTTEHCCYDHKCKSRNTNSYKTLIYIKWDDASYQEGPYYIGNIKPGVIVESDRHLV